MLSEDLKHPMHIDDYDRYCEALSQQREADRKHQRHRYQSAGPTIDHSSRRPDQFPELWLAEKPVV